MSYADIMLLITRYYFRHILLPPLASPPPCRYDTDDTPADAAAAAPFRAMPPLPLPL